MAVTYATFLYNHLPSEHGLCPTNLFTGSTVPRHRLKDIHVWGCPVYVLDPHLQAGRKIHCWEPRSGRGVFLGFSPLHSTQVPLVLNLNTGSITPQYHVVFNDHFSTVTLVERESDPPNHWAALYLEVTYIPNELHHDLHSGTSTTTLPSQYPPIDPDDRAFLQQHVLQTKAYSPSPVPTTTPDTDPALNPSFSPSSMPLAPIPSPVPTITPDTNSAPLAPLLQPAPSASTVDTPSTNISLPPSSVDCQVPNVSLVDCHVPRAHPVSTLPSFMPLCRSA
jgi:hypothetical protein